MNWKLKKILLILIGFVGGVFFLVFGVREFTRSKQLAAHGKVTQGEVLEVVAPTSFSRQSRLYYLEVQFNLENQTPCKERVRVSKAVYEAASPGDTVQVHYLPEDPTNCQIGDAVEIRYGTIVWGIVFLFAGGYLWVNFKVPADETEAAGMIGEKVKTLALDHFEYASVKAEDFKNVDLSFYAAVQKGLQGHGFVYLDDQENVTLRKRSGVRTFLRHLLGPDESTMAVIYHFTQGRKSAKVLDLETWFSNGCFVCTSNAEMAGKLDTPPEIGALRLPYDTSWETVLETHQRRVAEYLASHPGVTPVQLNGMADIRRAQAAQQQIKAAFRKKTGLSKAELERLAGGASPIVDRIHDELEKRQGK
jgi:hypothetical protein